MPLQPLIDHERQLIARYETRIARAEGTAVATISAVLALTALTASIAKTNDFTGGGVAVLIGIEAFVCFLALIVRSVAGLHLLHHLLSSEDFAGSDASRWARMASESKALADARQRLEHCDAGDPDTLEAILLFSRIRSKELRDRARSKEKWAGLASVALAVAVIATGALIAINLGAS